MRSLFGMLPVILAGAIVLRGATIEGIVKDVSGRPLENARIDHFGPMVIVASAALALPPSPNEIRTDATGHFRVITSKPALVIRKPGYESVRVRVGDDAQLSIALKPLSSPSRCRISPAPVFKTRAANDVDYTATWYYIKTKSGTKGVVSGRGATYSWGAPSDTDVWTSVEYSEFMFESGVVDASGHSADGKYWRRKSIFGSAAQYFNQTREIAEQLDCVLDQISLELR